MDEMIAHQIAADRPDLVRRLILIGTGPRAFLKRYLSRTENRDTPISGKVAPAQLAAIEEWGRPVGERFGYLKNIKQPALVVNGTHDIIVYTANSLHLAQNVHNAKLVLYPDANHGSHYQYDEDFVLETNRFSIVNSRFRRTN
jgi:pimeloyl-ACP methyl ester carboxylesterase